MASRHTAFRITDSPLAATTTTALATAIVTIALLGPAHAQGQQEAAPPPAYPPATAYPPPGYPQQGAYPQQQPGAYPQQPGVLPQPPKSHPIRDLFVGTLSAVIQAASGGAVNSIAQGVTGSITHWFDSKARKGQQSAQNYYPATDPYASAAQYPSGQPQYPQGQPQYPATTTDPYASAAQYPSGQPQYPQGQPQYPAATTDPYATAAQNPQDQATYPSGQPQYAADPYATDPYATQVYDPRTGQQVDAAGSVYGTASGTGSADSLYAGFAYEVHPVGSGNTSTPINAATHSFRSGDRFMVHFRPSLPGRMDVYNINPFGQQTRIDSVSVAAGQLTSLGPYEFAGTKGDESLRLVLAPCTTPQLLTTTRDIVNVSQPTAGGAGGIALANCDAPATRAVGQIRTRDIQKVAVDGSTSYALDQVSPTEVSSGNFASREVTIVFHHF